MNGPHDDGLVEVRRWLNQATEDLDAASRLSTSGGPARVVCFLSHLAAEKAIKAALIATKTPSGRFTTSSSSARCCLTTSLTGSVTTDSPVSTRG